MLKVLHNPDIFIKDRRLKPSCYRLFVFWILIPKYILKTLKKPVQRHTVTGKCTSTGNRPMVQEKIIWFLLLYIYNVIYKVYTAAALWLGFGWGSNLLSDYGTVILMVEIYIVLLTGISVWKGFVVVLLKTFFYSKVEYNTVLIKIVYI